MPAITTCTPATAPLTKASKPAPDLPTASIARPRA